MGRVVVIGAGVSGLGSALALSRSGHEVVVLERDRTPLPRSADEAFEWDRRGAPQVRHSHALLARLRNLLRDRFPDVLDALLEAGATEWRLLDRLPDTIDDPAPRPGDEDLVLLACRRTTFEWVLRRTVLAAEHVELRDGMVVDGVIASNTTRAAMPVVGGVRLSDGSIIEADTVVAANGRRGDVPHWLAELDVSISEIVEDTGIVYLSRFYRLRDGASVPAQPGPIGGDLGYLKYATFIGDNRTFSVTFAVPTGDDELRSLLLEPAQFEKVARVLPATAEWLGDDRADPITPVHVMARLLNRLRRFVDRDGSPLVLGFHAVGDAHTCTNPLYGRGCSLAMVQATLLDDAMRHSPDDPVTRARLYEESSARDVEPWYHAAVAADQDAKRDASSHARAQDDDAANPREFLRVLLRDGLQPALRTDATVLRAFIRTFNLLTPPDALLRDTDVIGRVMSVYNDRDNRPPEPPLGPETRAALLAAL